jgi:hypothetical protein
LAGKKRNKNRIKEQKKNMKKLLILLAFTLFTLGAYADVCHFGDANYDPIDCAAQNGTITGLPGMVGNANAVPVDGGASLLLASGLAMGTRKLRALRKARKEAKGK